MNIKLKGKANVKYSAINAKDIIMEGIYTPDVTITQQISNYQTNITSITFNDQYIVSIGDTLEVEIEPQKYKYKINYIEKIKKTKYILSTHLRNQSSVFITPCIFNNKAEIGWTMYPPDHIYAGADSCAYINTYITKELDQIGDYIYLKYLYKDSPTFKQLEQKLMNNSQFVSIIEKGQYTIYQFKVPIQFKQDLRLFYEGKFSLMSQDLKEKIIKFQGSSEAISDLNKIKRLEFDKINSPLAQVLFKLPQLKKKMELELGCSVNGELMSKCKHELEILI